MKGRLRPYLLMVYNVSICCNISTIIYLHVMGPHNVPACTRVGHLAQHWHSKQSQEGGNTQDDGHVGFSEPNLGKKLNMLVSGWLDIYNLYL